MNKPNWDLLKPKKRRWKPIFDDANPWRAPYGLPDLRGTKSALVDCKVDLLSIEYDEDRRNVIRRSKKFGVQTMVMPHTSMETTERACQLASEVEGVYCVVGIAPEEASEALRHYRDLRGLAAGMKRLLRKEGVIGLSAGMTSKKPRMQSEWDDQLKVFEVIARVSEETGTPLVLDWDSTYQAFGDVKQFLPETTLDRGIATKWPMRVEMAEALIERGFLMSFNTEITGPFKHPLAKRELATHLPLDMMVIASGAPYAIPDPWKKWTRSEPVMSLIMAEALAFDQDLDLEDFARLTTKNFKRVFPGLRVPNRTKQEAALVNIDGRYDSIPDEQLAMAEIITRKEDETRKANGVLIEAPIEPQVDGLLENGELDPEYEEELIRIGINGRQQVMELRADPKHLRML